MTAAIERFAREHNLTTTTVCRLIVTAKLAAKAGVTTCNTGDDKMEKYYGNLFEEFAKEEGFTVSWPGLYPVLYKNGYAYHLPD